MSIYVLDCWRKHPRNESASHFLLGGIIIIFSIAVISLLFGLVGLFVRGYSLWRVPFHFLTGGIFFFLAMRLLRVNVLEWQSFVYHLH